MFHFVTALTVTPRAFWFLFVEFVLTGLALGLAYWAYTTFIKPNIPAAFVWILEILIGLALIGLVFWVFFGF